MMENGITIFKKLDSEKMRPFVRNIVMMITFTLFLPYQIASAVILCVAGTFCIIPGTRCKIMIHRCSIPVFLFAAITCVVAIYYGNHVGFIRGAIFTGMMIICFVVRSFANRRFYEKLLNCIVIGGTVSSVSSIFEAIINRDVPFYRCQTFFTNPNFFGTAIMLVILICAYKIVTRAENISLYYIATVVNIIGIYLCGSMSLWFIMFIGITVLLLLNHEYRLLAGFFAIVGIICVAIVLVPQIIPRLNELSSTTTNRVQIWSFAIEQIKEAPIFGRGFFSYKFLYNELGSTQNIYPAALAHNILFDCMLCHGIVGTALVGFSIVQYIKSLLISREKLKAYNHKYTASTFVCAVATAIICYGMFDTTFVWVQTGMIVLLICTGVGVDEHEVRKIERRKREEATK